MDGSATAACQQAAAASSGSILIIAAGAGERSRKLTCQPLPWPSRATAAADFHPGFGLSSVVSLQRVVTDRE